VIFFLKIKMKYGIVYSEIVSYVKLKRCYLEKTFVTLITFYGSRIDLQLFINFLLKNIEQNHVEGVCNPNTM